MENVPALDVTPSPTSADEASNAAFAQKMGELVEAESDDATESWIWIRYGPIVYEQETEDDK